MTSKFKPPLMGGIRADTSMPAGMGMSLPQRVAYRLRTMFAGCIMVDVFGIDLLQLDGLDIWR